MSYNSKHTGAEVDALLDKAGTAVQPNNLAAVATSGSYNDLVDTPTIPAEQVNADWNATSGKAQILNKPTIPAAVTQNTVSGWGFTKNTGTVTGVKINGSTKNPSNGVVDLGTVITAHQTLKTINGQSIVGSGDIPISGGGEQIEEPYVHNSSGNKVIMFENATVNNTPVNTPMMPGVTYVCTEPVDGVILYNIQPPTGNTGKYTLHFAIDAQGGYLDLNTNLSFYYPNGEVNLELEPFGTYELSIVATKLVYNGGTFWLYKAVLTSFKFH